MGKFRRTKPHGPVVRCLTCKRFATESRARQRLDPTRQPLVARWRRAPDGVRKASAGLPAIGRRRPIENRICKSVRPHLPWGSPSDRTSAGRATSRGSPGPTWKQSLLPARCGHQARVADPDGIDIGSPVKPGRQLQAPGRASSLWVPVFAPPALVHRVSRFAARIRALPPARGLSFPIEESCSEHLENPRHPGTGRPDRRGLFRADVRRASGARARLAGR